MNENKTSCAPADNQQTLWDSIDWTKAELAVRKLQARIVKAQKEGRYNKVKALQWTLTHSFYAKALAVKRVTSNGGGNTPGVDMETWEKPEAKTQAISELKRRGYQPKPLRRVHIKKSNGKLRPLGIPTMKDRAMQALYLMALEPVSETTADTRSYGFRKERRCMDAVQQCHNILRKGYSPEWILEGDIKGCFDHISHEWLLANIPMDKAMLRKWLKCGYIFNKQMFPTEEGTPQGGIISPTLANMTLDGLQKVLAEKYKRVRIKGKLYSPMVNLVRYADDFLIGVIGSKEDARQVKSDVGMFIRKNLHLEMSQEKTLITHGNDFAHFLGYLITISREQNSTRTRTGFTRRIYVGKVKLYVPKEKWVNRLLSYGALRINCDKAYGNKEVWEPVRRPGLMRLDDIEILNQYNAEVRGTYNYYRLANNATVLNNFLYVMKFSMYKTFAGKYRTNMRKIIRKYCHNGDFTVSYPTKNGTKSVVFYNQGMRHNGKVVVSENPDIIGRAMRIAAIPG